MTDYAKPLPKISAETRPFWDGLHAHELRIQRCTACARYRFPPQKMCRHCNSLETSWSPVSGKGTVYSFAVPTLPSPGELPARGFDYPYAVVLIELDGTDGVRMASNIADCPPDEIAIGMSVEVVFERATDEVTLPRFRRV